MLRELCAVVVATFVNRVLSALECLYVCCLCMGACSVLNAQCLKVVRVRPSFVVKHHVLTRKCSVCVE